MQITAQAADGATTILVVAGELDVATATELREAGESALTDGCEQLVLDLADVTFLDSSGLGALIAIRNVAIEGDRSLVLRNPSSRVGKVLELSGLTDVFTVESE